jgi:hypothetical protein
MRMHFLHVVLILIALMAISGCIELGRQTNSADTALFSYSVTEIQYLYTDEGLFRSRFVVDADIPMVGQFHREMNEGEFREWTDNFDSILPGQGTVTTPGAVQTKSVGATASASSRTVTLTYQGGPDAGLVEDVTWSIDGVEQIPIGPEPGRSALTVGSAATGTGSYGNNHVIAVAHFSDGSAQVILDAYIVVR